jgi:hypothetical protein
MDFYNERRGIMAQYGVEAPTPAAAALMGRAALLAEYPPIPARRKPGLFEQAQRVGGQNADGWVLHRIVSGNSEG